MKCVETYLYQHETIGAMIFERRNTRIASKKFCSFQISGTSSQRYENDDQQLLVVANKL